MDLIEQLDEFIKNCKELLTEIGYRQMWSDDLADKGITENSLDLSDYESRILFDRLDRLLKKTGAEYLKDDDINACENIIKVAKKEGISRRNAEDLIVILTGMRDMVAEKNGSGDKSAKKDRLLFISHSHEDALFAGLLVELLCELGFNERSVVCTSVPGFGIPMGENIYRWIHERFNSSELHVIYLLSKKYYESVASLNEMGATWVSNYRWDAILLPEFNFSEVTGCIDKEQITLKLDNEEAGYRLGELKDKLTEEFELSEMPAYRWEKYRDAFLGKISTLGKEKGGNDDTFTPKEAIVYGLKKNRLSQRASLLAAYATKDSSGTITVLSTLSGKYIGTYKWNMSYRQNARDEAMWLSAIDELVGEGLIKASGRKGEIYQLTGEGYEYADAYIDEQQLDLEKAPGEYIK